jgi:hypothetical protein
MNLRTKRGEKDEYKSLKKKYDRLMTKYETHRRGLGTIRTKIQEAVSGSNPKIHLTTCLSPSVTTRSPGSGN